MYHYGDCALSIGQWSQLAPTLTLRQPQRKQIRPPELPATTGTLKYTVFASEFDS